MSAILPMPRGAEHAPTLDACNACAWSPARDMPRAWRVLIRPAGALNDAMHWHKSRTVRRVAYRLARALRVLMSAVVARHHKRQRALWAAYVESRHAAGIAASRAARGIA